MFNFEALEIVFDPPGYDVHAIVRDDGVWDPIPGDDVSLDEFLRSRGSDCLVGGCFHPLGKVVDRHEDKAVTIGGCRINCPNNVYPLG